MVVLFLCLFTFLFSKMKAENQDELLGTETEVSYKQRVDIIGMNEAKAAVPAERTLVWARAGPRPETCERLPMIE